MAKQRKIYAQRRPLRVMEKGWTAFERFINRITAVGPKVAPYNPFYHLGTLTIFLLIILTITGFYLVIFYRPGTDRAYLSVAGMSDNWFNLLIRTVHRYTSDAIIVVAFLHALKMFVSDRFWGSRWFAWISGWAMMGVLWVMGLMGYWLVWDQSAQWLTEYFMAFTKGPFAHSILAGGADLASSTYALFVIVLFLHVFVPPLVLVFVLIHVVRLARSRYWSPRWLMISSVIALVLISIWRPAPLPPPANLNQLVTQIDIDWFYMGFLPLAETVGAPIFWGFSLLLLLFAFVLPWIWPGQHNGPAMVIEDSCTGCSACARECPYDAIQMVQRDDQTEFESLAIVTPSKCVGCGICVGACHDDAIELDRLYSRVIRQDLKRNSVRADRAGDPAVTVYVCDRHEAMGTLPPLDKPKSLDAAEMGIGGMIPLLQAKQSPRVNVGTWVDGGGEDRSVITAVMPCTGMIHPNWAAEVIEAGGAGAIVVSCPVDDCAHREGPHWINERLKRRRTFRKGNTHFIELPPGGNKEVMSLWAEMVDEGNEAASHASTVIGSAGKEAIEADKQNIWGKARYLGTGLLILLVVFVASMLVNRPATNPIPERGQIRLVITHGGQLLNTINDIDPETAAKLPDNVDPSMLLGGERHPVQLRVAVDGDILFEESYDPRGLRNEGAIFAQEALWLAPDSYGVEIWLMDDEVEWRSVFADTIVIADEEVSNLVFDEGEGMFLQTE